MSAAGRAVSSTMDHVHDTPSERPVAAVTRARGALYTAGLAVRVLVALGALAVLAAPLELAWVRLSHASGPAGFLAVAGLVFLGLGLPVVAFALARMDGAAACTLLRSGEEPPNPARLQEPSTLVRPLAYTVVMVTLGGAASVALGVALLGALVAVVSPLLTWSGEFAVIGPVTVTTLPGALGMAALGIGVLLAVLAAAPVVARAHADLALAVLSRPEQSLRRDLVATARSRARLVRSFDTDRRRIERDLHDGIQPQLVSVTMTLGLALGALPPESPGRADVVRAQEQARATLESLRSFVRRVHPPVLVDHGLGAAVAELADGLPLPIDVDDRLPGRLPAEVESTLYFCVAELLTNAAKHAGASRVSVQIDRLGDDVHVSVEDDGRGGASVDDADQGGLAGIVDRVAALGGTVRLSSPPGGPTRIGLSAKGTDDA